MRGDGWPSLPRQFDPEPDFVFIDFGVPPPPRMNWSSSTGQWWSFGAQTMNRLRLRPSSSCNRDRANSPTCRRHRRRASGSLCRLPARRLFPHSLDRHERSRCGRRRRAGFPVGRRPLRYPARSSPKVLPARPAGLDSDPRDRELARLQYIPVRPATPPLPPPSASVSRRHCRVPELRRRPWSSLHRHHPRLRRRPRSSLHRHHRRLRGPTPATVKPAPPPPHPAGPTPATVKPAPPPPPPHPAGPTPATVKPAPPPHRRIPRVRHRPRSSLHHHHHPHRPSRGSDTGHGQARTTTPPPASRRSGRG